MENFVKKLLSNPDKYSKMGKKYISFIRMKMNVFIILSAIFECRSQGSWSLFT